MSKQTLTPEQSARLKDHAEKMTGIYKCMAARGEHLHKGQVRVAKDLFQEGKKVIQSQWGRSCGKTLTSCYVAWVFALLNPESIVYIITPERKQGKDIYWLSGRIQNFGPKEYLVSEKINVTDLTIQFKNGSIIKIDGCENYEAHRGVKPHLVIYDEFQHHSKEFHLEVMQPNLTAKKASLVVFGTPPKRDCYYVTFRKQLLEEIKDGDTSRSYYEFPSHLNPSLDKVELEKIRVRLIKSGEEKIWLREYMAQLIFGGEGAVFSPWSREKHLRAHKVLMAALEKDMGKLRWFTVFDPGNMTCFAVLFAAYNAYTSQLYILDEIYETNSRNTDAVSMFKRSVAKEKELYPNRPPRTFHRIYDEAALWFYVNLAKYYRNDPEFHMNPCQKNKMKGQSSKEADCSLIKQVMGSDNTFYVSDRCEKFVWETENYVVDENGNYPKDHDHLIPDCTTYLLKGANYKFVEEVPEDETLRSQSVISAFGNKKMQKLSDHSEWSDNIVEDSLWVDNLYDEYLQ